MAKCVFTANAHGGFTKTYHILLCKARLNIFFLIEHIHHFISYNSVFRIKINNRKITRH